jgi:hypothetical protein
MRFAQHGCLRTVCICILGMGSHLDITNDMGSLERKIDLLNNKNFHT